MTANAQSGGGRNGVPWRLIGWGGAAFLLLLPWLTNAPWTASDFVVMGVLFVIVGLALELAVRASGNGWFRAGAGVAVVASFLLVWMNLAVGFLGDEDNPANLMFLAVIATAVAGSFAARFRAAGMAQAMIASAVVQASAAAIGLAAGWASPGAQGLYEAVLGTSLFGGLWLLSARLFRKAAPE